MSSSFPLSAAELISDCPRSLGTPDFYRVAARHGGSAARRRLRTSSETGNPITVSSRGKPALRPMFSARLRRRSDVRIVCLQTLRLSPMRTAPEDSGLSPEYPEANSVWRDSPYHQTGSSRYLRPLLLYSQTAEVRSDSHSLYIYFLCSSSPVDSPFVFTAGTSYRPLLLYSQTAETALSCSLQACPFDRL